VLPARLRTKATDASNAHDEEANTESDSASDASGDDKAKGASKRKPNAEKKPERRRLRKTHGSIHPQQLTADQPRQPQVLQHQNVDMGQFTPPANLQYGYPYGTVYPTMVPAPPMPHMHLVQWAAQVHLNFPVATPPVSWEAVQLQGPVGGMGTPQPENAFNNYQH
jgi:hypothetical protein